MLWSKERIAAFDVTSPIDTSNGLDYTKRKRQQVPMRTPLRHLDGFGLYPDLGWLCLQSHD